MVQTRWLSARSDNPCDLPFCSSLVLSRLSPSSPSSCTSHINDTTTPRSTLHPPLPHNPLLPRYRTCLSLGALIRGRTKAPYHTFYPYPNHNAWRCVNPLPPPRIACVHIKKPPRGGIVYYPSPSMRKTKERNADHALSKMMSQERVNQHASTPVSTGTERQMQEMDRLNRCGR